MITYEAGIIILILQLGAMHILNYVTCPRSRSPSVVTSQVEARSFGFEVCAFPTLLMSEVTGFLFDVLLLLFLLILAPNPLFS